MTKYHTVADLISLLKQLPENAIVTFSKDAEGNGFRPWSGDHSYGYFVKVFDFEQFINVTETDELKEYKNRQLMDAIILWPED